MRITAALVLLLAVRNVSAQQLDQFEKILLPVSPNVTLLGFHSQYNTSMAYSCSRPIRYYPAAHLSGNTFGIGTLMPSLGDALSIPGNGPASGIGRILFVERGATDDIELTLSLNTGDAIYGTPTTVPIVRESQFRTGRTVLPAIQLTRHISSSCTIFTFGCTTVSADRLKLYVYDPDGDGSNKILLRVTGTHPVETVLSLNQRNGSDPSYPFYTELEYDPAFGEYPMITERVSVELVPMQEHAHYWAFATIIPSSSNSLAFISPRP